MSSAHTQNHKTEHKAANGSGHRVRDVKVLVDAIDGLIRARIAHVRDASMGPEESDKLHHELTEHFRRLLA